MIPRPSFAGRHDLVRSLLSLTLTLALGLAGFCESSALDVLAPTFEGHPLAVIERRQSFTDGYLAAGVVGDRWRWLSVTADGYALQLDEGRGGAPEATAVLGPIEGTPGTPLGPNTGKALLGNLAQDPLEPLDNPAFVFVAGRIRNGLYHWDGARTTMWLGSYAPHPAVANAVVEEISSIAYASNQVALAAEFTGPGLEGLHSGIYRVSRGGPLKVVADWTTPLPGRTDPGRFVYNALAFDGRALAFEGIFGAGRAWFLQVDENAPVEALAPARMALPNGAILASIDEVGLIPGGLVLTAEDSAGVGYLLQRLNGAWSILAREGDRTVEGRMVTGLAQAHAPYSRTPTGAGLVIDGARIYFGAQIAGKTAIAYWEAGAIHEAISPGPLFPHEAVGANYEPLRLRVLQARGDLLVASVEYGPNRFGITEREFHWVATLPRPAKPVIWGWTSNATVSVGETLEWEVKVAGDAPLTYLLNGPRGVKAPVAEGRWRLDPVTGADAGDYQLTVTNTAGIARAPILRLTVPAPPKITQSPTPQSLRPGERLELQAQVEGGADLVCTWFRNGEVAASFELAHPQRTLVRPAMSLADVGWYTLVAQNPYGSVTSAPVRVTMTSEPSTATWAGHPLLAAIIALEPTLPFGSLVNPSPYHGTGRGRWQGESLWWSSDYANAYHGFISWGLYQVIGRQVTQPFGPSVELPAGLGAATSVRLVESGQETDPISVLASAGPSTPAAGLYRLAGLRLVPWLDTTTAPPPANDGTADAWVQWHDAYQSGERFILTATTAHGLGLFLVENGQAKRVLDLSRASPPEVTAPLTSSTPAFDGHTAAVIVSGKPEIKAIPGVLVSVSLEGLAVQRIATGDPLPGTTNRVAGLTQTALQAGTLYATAWDDARLPRAHVLAWTGDAVRHVAGPGTPIRGGGTLDRVLGMRVESGGPRVLISARYTHEVLPTHALFLVHDDGVEAVVSGNEFGVENVGDFEVADFAGDRLAFLTGSGFPVALFVNTATPGDFTTTLTVERGISGSVRLGAQPRALLEWAPTALGPWGILSAPGATWDLPANEAQGFFRPRRP